MKNPFRAPAHARRPAPKAPKPVAPPAPARVTEPTAPKRRLRLPRPAMPDIGRGPAAVRRRRVVLWPLVGATTILGLLVIGVFPTRTFLAQRGDLSATAERLAVVQEQNELLASRVDDLSTDAEIERIAREQYNLVRPGEEAYAILPAPEPPVQVPDAWPFTGLHAKLAQLAAASG